MNRSFGNQVIYDGEGEFKSFKNAFMYDSLLFGWKEEQQVLAIEYCLKGKALKVFKSLDDSKRKSLTDIFKALEEKCSKSPDYYLNLFYLRKMNANETIASYCYAIQELLERAMPSLNEEDKEKFLKARLIANVPEHVKTYLEMLSDKSWRELCDIFNKSVDYKNMENREPDMEIKSEVSVAKAAVSYSNNNNNSNKAKFSGECYYCHKIGHRMNDCWRKKNATSQPRTSQDSNRNREENFQRNRDNYQSSIKRSHSFGGNQESKKPTVNFNFSKRTDGSQSSNFRNKQSGPKAFNIDAYEELDEDEEVEMMSVSFKCEDLKKRTRLHRLNVTVDLGGVDVNMNMLVDSGSTSSFINPKMLPSLLSDNVNDFLSSKLRSNSLNLKRSKIHITAAISEKSLECALAVAKIKINDWIGEQEFIFSDIIKETAILGCDFLEKYNANFEFSTGKLLIRDNSKIVSLNFLENKIAVGRTDDEIKTNFLEEQIYYNAYIKDDVVIKAECEMLLNVKVDKLVDLVLFEHKNEYHINEGLVWANSVNLVDNKNEIVVSVINTSNQDIKINKNEIVGEIFEIDERNIQISNIETDENIQLTDPKNFLSKLDIGQNLSNNQKFKLEKLIGKYEHIFQWNDYDVGLSNATKHSINTGNAKPIKQNPYRLPQTAKEEVENQISKMLENDIIETSKSPWSSPIILVKKKTQTDEKQQYRFCIDFRKLNQVTIKDCYPLPRIDETVDALGGAKFFSTLDLASGYWQVPVSEKDREKTAFCANNKLFQFKVMPFGLCNAPSTFQRLMDTILRNLTWKYCLVYLDDIIVFSSNFDAHIERLELIFKELEIANLKLKPSKCNFIKENVNYLGFNISEKGLKPDSSKVRAVAEMNAPTNKDEIKRFLGAISYYRRFIKNFGDIASCLWTLTKKDTTFIWTDETEKAFRKLKQELVQSPILVFPDFKNNFEIFTDASKLAIGAALCQRVNNVVHPVSFASRQLNKNEVNYSTTEKEMLAVVWAAKYFKPYIYGRHTIFFTDHKPLSTLVRAKEPTGRLYRLLLKLQELDYEIVYTPGVLNKTADMLSRPNAKENERCVNKIDCEIKSIDVQLSVDWASEQDLDKELAIVKANIKRDNFSDGLVELENYQMWKKNLEYLILKQNVLFLKNKENIEILVVPKHLRQKICKIYHESLTVGHIGFEKQYLNVSHKFYWPKMKSQIFDYCMTCDVCQKQKIKNKSNVAPMISITVDKPWDLVGIDVAGPLKLTNKKNQYIIIAIDYFTKFCVSRATTDWTADTTVEFLKNDLVNKFGVPTAILSDQGRNFESKKFNDFCTNFGIKKLRTTSYHPQCNGLAERTIRTVKQKLSCSVNDNHDNWDDLLSDVTFSYNNSVHSSIGLAPNELIFGKVLESAADRTLGVENKIKNSISVNEEKASEINRKAHEKQSKSFEKEVRNLTEFKIGDYVLLHNTKKVIGHVKSFEAKHNGPYTITKVINDVNFEIKHCSTGIKSVVHYNRLFKYNMRQNIKSDDRSTINSVTDKSIDVLSPNDNFQRQKLLLSQLLTSKMRLTSSPVEVVINDSEYSETEEEMPPLEDLNVGNGYENENRDENIFQEADNEPVRAEYEDETIQANALNNPEENNTDDKIQCEFCIFKAKNEAGLKIHKRAKHLNV